MNFLSQSAGAHTHTLTGHTGYELYNSSNSSLNTGNSGNLPPYYALYFIIKYKETPLESSTVHNLKVYRYIK